MPRQATKFNEVLLLPVQFIFFTFVVVYYMFIAFWCLPALQLDLPPDKRNLERHLRAASIVVTFHGSLFMFGWSFFKTMYTDPGAIPDTDEWRKAPDPLKLRERKSDGKLRWDHFEEKYKPDRACFSSVMQRNILKMDHYCPWVANGIGFYNYKFFLLTLFYGSVCLVIVTVCMLHGVISNWQNYEVPYSVLYFNFLGVSLGLFLSLIVIPFFGFHLWLTSHNITTIEYCERHATPATHPYDLGSVFDNFAVVLGVNTHVWFIPVGEPVGDGLFFPRRDHFAAERHQRRRRHHREYDEQPLLDVKADV